MRHRVVIGLSGGVDSGVSAFLLKEEGFDVIGVTFILNKGQDIERVRKIAKVLDADLKEVNLINDFEQKIINYFLEEYSKGRTPNPCALCNRLIKFPELLKQAISLNADFISTGHYALIRREPFGLLKGKDPKKDQSYFLSLVDREILRKTIFPLGERSREEVINLAKKIGIDKFVSFKGSQDVCFIEGSFRNFIKKTLRDKLKRGLIKDLSGKTLGEHEGIALYTVGQRRRLNVATGIRQYVVALDAENNEVIMGKFEDLLRKDFIVNNVNWFIDESEIQGEVKVRYHTPPSEARAIPIGSGRVKVILKEPLAAITPGQLATFYIKDQVVWGGIIE